MSLTQFIGYSGSSYGHAGETKPFGFHLNMPTYYCLLYVENGKVYSWKPITGEREELKHWSENQTEENIKGKDWSYMTVVEFKHFFPKHMAVLQIPALAASRPLSIKKGSLYFNTTSARVERVIAIVDGSLIWTSRHKQKADAYPRSAFRLANQVEVDAYLTEAKVG